MRVLVKKIIIEYTITKYKRIKIIRSLRCANYSFSTILKFLKQLGKNKFISIQDILNTVQENEKIVLACDKLLIPLKNPQNDCIKMINQNKKISSSL